MPVSTTLILTAASKTAAVTEIDQFLGLESPFTYDSMFGSELTDGTDSFYAYTGFIDEDIFAILINGNYIQDARFPENYTEALADNSLSTVGG